MRIPRVVWRHLLQASLAGRGTYQPKRLAQLLQQIDSARQALPVNFVLEGRPIDALSTHAGACGVATLVTHTHAGQPSKSHVGHTAQCYLRNSYSLLISDTQRHNLMMRCEQKMRFTAASTGGVMSCRSHATLCCRQHPQCAAAACFTSSPWIARLAKQTPTI